MTGIPDVANLVGRIDKALRDVTRQRRIEREPTVDVSHDPLTGSLNRTAFVERVRRAMADRAVAVVLVGLDDVKMINDALGPDAGDGLLIAGARRLAAAVPPGVPVARLGGNEFAAVIDGIGEPADAHRHVEQILAAFESPLVVDAYSFSTTASAGVAVSDGSQAVNELLRQAFLALSTARRFSKGSWQQYEPPMQVAALQRLQIHVELDRAVNERAFTLAYQPIVSLDSTDVIGFEALVRWRHPRYGLIPPGRFIHVAERTGLIVAIGDWVLEQAVLAAARWPAAPGNPPSVNVNVSARQIRNPGFVGAVRRHLDRARLPADRLTLEITETLLLHDGEQVWNDLARLRDHGVRVAIDDFGTGYSSLSYLRHTPVDIIKIDRSFVRDLATSRQQWAVVESIVLLAHRLGLQVVAEGIERPDERAALWRLGCPFGQGFLFARPLSAADAVRRLRPPVT